MPTQQQQNPPQDSAFPLSLSPEELYDYVVTSDGSGWYVDRIGAWAAIVTSWKDPRCRRIVSCGGSTHTETGRAEFIAMLTAMHSIVETIGLEEDSGTMGRMEMDKPTLHIISDRENIVNIINGVNEAHKNLDLWYQFSWYQRYFEISAEHIHGHKHLREEHDRADCLASLCRISVQDFVGVQTEAGHM